MQTLEQYVLWRVPQIYRKLVLGGDLQVRWHEGKLITYQYPAPRGHGTRGILVGVYTAKASAQWIIEDALSLIKTLSDPYASVPRKAMVISGTAKGSR